MHRQNALDRLQLQDDRLLDDDVSEIGALETNIFVDDRQRHLPPERQAAMREFPAEAFFVNRFEQTGAQFPVHLDGETDDPVGWVAGVHIGTILAPPLPLR
jgi:hypothetical protein